MASILKHLRSSTANKRPTASGLADGQIAINTASGTPALFFKDNASNIVKVGPAHVGATAPNTSPAGSAGNSTGELWVDNSLTTNGLKYYDGASFINLTPSGTATTVGLVELATDAETQAGTDATRVVTPSGLQSKVSDSTSTTSSTTIASSTAVKSAFDLANAALPKAGGTITGAVTISPSGSLIFEGSTDDSFETTLAVVDPTADRTITIPNITGTVITTGDSGTVTSTMIADGTIVDGDINSAAAITLTKLGTGALPTTITVSSGNIVDGTISNIEISASAAIADTKLDTIATADKVSLSALNIDGGTDIGAALADADLFIVDDGGAGTNRKAAATRITDYAFGKVSGDITITSSGVASIGSGKVTSTMILDGTIVNADVNASAAIAGTKISPDFGSQNTTTTGTSTAASFIPSSSTAPTNGLYLPAANSVALATGGSGRLFVDSSGNVGVGQSGGGRGGSGTRFLAKLASGQSFIEVQANGTSDANALIFSDGSTGNYGAYGYDHSNDSAYIQTAGNDRIRITSGGLVGIGVSSPSYLLDCKSSGATNVARFLTGATTSSEVAQFGRSDQAVNLSIDYDGAGAMGIGTTTAHPFNLKTGAVTRATIDTSGRLGIGTTTASSLLSLRSTAANNTAGISMQGATSGNITNIYDTFSDLVVEHAGSEAFRIDASRRLLVGTSSARTIEPYGLGTDGQVANTYESVSDTAPGPGLALSANSTTARMGPYLYFCRSGAATVGSNTIVVNGDNLGTISFAGADGTDVRTRGAAIYCEVDGTPGANDMPGRLVFSTTADGSASPTEQMRLDNAGNLKFNSGYGSAATAYGCRAWVNFNGNGTVAIRASGNVSSITDAGVGTYEVNFATSMPDSNYAQVCWDINYGIGWYNNPSTTKASIVRVNNSFAAADNANISFAVFR